VAQLNVDPDYKCSPNNGNFQFPNNTTLSVNPPNAGCTLIFSVNVPAQNGQTTYNFSNGTQQDIDFSGFSNGTTIKYCATAYQGSCTPTSLAEDTGHTITIDSSGGRPRAHDIAHTITMDSGGS
jgi:hypothetical protein